MTTTDKPQSVAETLRAARALIEDPKRWIKGAEAQTSKRGLWVPATDPEAEAWCMVGAIHRVDGPYESEALYVLRNVIGYGIAEYNDKYRRRHAEVMATFTKAIEIAEKVAVPA